MAKRMARAAERADEEYQEGQRPVGPRAVAYAVLAQGLKDAVDGDRGAQEWLGSPGFVHWCDWCGLRPDYVLRMVKPKIVVRDYEPKLPQYTRTNIPPDMYERAERLYQAGATLREASQRVGVNYHALYSYMYRHGLLPNITKKTRIDPDVYAAAAELLRAGLSRQEISERLGLKYSTLCSWIDRENMPLTRKRKQRGIMTVVEEDSRDDIRNIK